MGVAGARARLTSTIGERELRARAEPGFRPGPRTPQNRSRPLKDAASRDGPHSKFLGTEIFPSGPRILYSLTDPPTVSGVDFLISPGCTLRDRGVKGMTV